jgi:SP family general alpha glucoside:H+ symporter-like MFS transporter
MGERLGVPDAVGSAMDVSHSRLSPPSRVYSLGGCTRWILPLFIGISLAPDSPWLLVRKNKMAEARVALLRLTSPERDPNFDVDATLAMMQHTTELERETTKTASYLDCFRGTNLRRTEIVCMVWAIQNLSGNSFTGYTTFVSSCPA